MRQLLGLCFTTTLTAGLIAACVGDSTIEPPVDASTDTTTTNDASNDANNTLDSTNPVDATSTDANDAGLIEAGPTPVTRAFLSSMKYYGDSIGGLTAADNDCQLLATAASRGAGWKAWLSTSTTNAKDHITLGSGNIMLVDGLTVVVAHGTDLIGDGGLLHAIDHNENGQSVAASLVWTGTTQNGLVYAGNGPPCGDWTASDGGASAGGSNQTGATWTSDGIEPCTNSYPIYCFGP